MSINNIKLSLVIACLLIISGNELIIGQETKSKSHKQLGVVKAVAPIFVPFVYGETGVNEVVIRVKINKEGKVTSAQTISVTVMRDLSFEDTAKQWLFESSPNDEERTTEIKFIMRIMPKGTSIFDLTTTYTFPNQIEVKHAFVEPRIETYPTETDPAQTKKPPRTRFKRKVS